MSSKAVHFSNNIRTIVFIIIVSAVPIFFLIKHFGVPAPTSYIYISAAMAIPIAAMGVNLNGLWAIKKHKDVSSSERRRLIYIANKKAWILVRSIALYTIIIILVNVLSSFMNANKAPLYLTSILLGTIFACIYSVLVTFYDNKKLSDFDAKLQEKANVKAAMNQFQGSKSK